MLDRGAVTQQAAPGALDRLLERPRGLDPRTKMLLVVTASIAVMGTGGLRFVLPALLLGLGLALWEGARQRAFGLLATALVMWFLGWVLPLWWPGTLTAIISIACVYLIRFTAAIGIGMHVITTTSPTQLSAALRAWRAPRAISVTLATMLRFFPVVASEAMAVLDAMRLRGLVGTGGFLRHPLLSIERFTVPMIAASLRASEDLSASAILRGLGSHHTPTAMVAPRFGRADLVLLVLVVVFAAAALMLPSPLG